MAIVTMELDPDATSYTDDEIVTKINDAANSITREAALSQDDLKILKTNPVVGEFYVKNVQRGADGKLQVEYDDVAVI